jgi:hypothetical protein
MAWASDVGVGCTVRVRIPNGAEEYNVPLSTRQQMAGEWEGRVIKVAGVGPNDMVGVMSEERGRWMVYRRHVISVGPRSGLPGRTLLRRQSKSKEAVTEATPSVSKQPTFPPAYSAAVPQHPQHWMLPATVGGGPPSPPAIARRRSARLAGSAPYPTTSTSSAAADSTSAHHPLMEEPLSRQYHTRPSSIDEQLSRQYHTRKTR